MEVDWESTPRRFFFPFLCKPILRLLSFIYLISNYTLLVIRCCLCPFFSATLFSTTQLVRGYDRQYLYVIESRTNDGFVFRPLQTPRPYCRV